MSDLKRGDDLFAKMGKDSSAKGSSGDDPSQKANAGTPVGNATPDDLTAAAANVQVGADKVPSGTDSASGKVEPAKSDIVQDPSGS